MELKVGDLVLILPPEEFGLDRHSTREYRLFWNNHPVKEDGMWLKNTVNMDFYVSKVARVTDIFDYENSPTAHLVLHEIYGQKGDGWTFNVLHLKKLEDENNI